MNTSNDSEQDKLTDPELELLTALRGAMGPGRADQGRVRAALTASLAAGNLGPKLPSDSGAGLPQGGPAGLQGLGWQITAAALMALAGFGAGFWVGQRSHSSHSVAIAGPQALPTPPAPETTQPKQRPDEWLPIAPTSHALPSTSPHARSVEPRLLAEEAEALRRVGQALRDGMPALAEQILDDLERRIPRGALSEERGAARVMIACRSGDANAREAARTWLKRHPRSVYTPRVRASCWSEEEP